MFDPAQPAEGSPLQSAVMRSQLTSLKALIDAILTLTAAQVDGVTTLNPGDPATAGVVVDGNTLRFTFGIPRGDTGAQGNPGADGGPGPEGPQGPPFATAVVDGVTTLAPGDPAAVSVSFDGTNVRFTFGIPQGAHGETGPPFAQAVVDGVTTLAPGDPATVDVSFDGTNVRFTFGIPQGAQGETGPPGGVTQAALDAAMATTAQNPTSVSPLSLTADPAYNPAQLQQVADKLDELLGMLKRPF